MNMCFPHVHYQSKQLPEEYKTELRGLADGGKAAGCSECGNYVNRAVVLANAPGDLKVSSIPESIG